MHKEDLLNRLSEYQTIHMDEAGMVARTLRFIEAHDNCFDRNLSYGHVTGSSWILNPAHSHTLMLHHRKLDWWLQPGGHADGDPDILQVVLKEASEETGIDEQHIHLVSEDIFDVDIHTIFPSVHDHRHEHFDIRFLFEVDDRLEIPGNDESHEVAWIPLNQVCHLNNLRSLHRMVRKSLALKRATT